MSKIYTPAVVKGFFMTSADKLGKLLQNGFVVQNRCCHCCYDGAYNRMEICDMCVL